MVFYRPEDKYNFAIDIEVISKWYIMRKDNIKKKTEYNTSQSTDSLTNRFICEYLLINIVSVFDF